MLSQKHEHIFIQHAKHWKNTVKEIELNWIHDLSVDKQK